MQLTQCNLKNFIEKLIAIICFYHLNIHVQRTCSIVLQVIPGVRNTCDISYNRTESLIAWIRHGFAFKVTSVAEVNIIRNL